ncbi:sister chromatid cohesion protein PDS5 homolog A isoform X1 [Dioscorea cayenensis subsp. rotundata]|uniref:Sister chromatid cohesion protein PDS5 homolog A isoform X1 n=1 Tax=Dioscorea cayennensis subsp. rotundata TaxID=55577 RepID=A0AB40AVC2_DIOCR|nr:sister chromatid cohesion protein PDS5 homolog A isoform X1 [Dioscorea cayenensis subsp. rotundata]
MAQKQQLRELGSKLDSPPASKDALIKLLKQAAKYLSELDQSQWSSMSDFMKPFLNAVAKKEYLNHQDRDVKVLVATCICEITRITAPEAPYSDDVLKDIFNLIVGTLSGLSDINSPSFGRRVLILETLARYRSCVVMLDLECHDLINEMFNTFFAVVSDDHPENVLTSMQTIMVLILEESEDIQENLLNTILSVLGRKRKDISMAARKLSMKVIELCTVKLEPGIKQFLVSALSGDSSYLKTQIEYHEVIYDLYQCAPKILHSIIPYLTGELLTDKLDIRQKAVNLLGDLFALPGCPISEPFQPLFSEFLKRLTDRVVDVRVSVIEHVKNCLLSNPSRPEASQIISALSDRLMDYDENVRKHVVAAICDVACHSLKGFPTETVKLVADRLRDKSLAVKGYAMERLAELYKLYCLKSVDDSISRDGFEWIPGKIVRCLYDKDLRSETIEQILCGSLFPPEMATKDMVEHWTAVFSGLDKVEVKALDQLLMQKQRLQQELQSYLSLRQRYQEGGTVDIQKKISACIRSMSRLFNDPVKAEESFQILNQLKDMNIWKLLKTLLDPCTTFRHAWTVRDDLLKILGEKHPLYDFMGILSIKCSYLFFNQEYVKEILSMASQQNSSGNRKLLASSMNLLAMIGCFSPLLLAGSEEALVNLLKEDNDITKEGIAHVLAKAGGTIRENLGSTSSAVDLLLERLCLEGSRKQAKYSVQALAAITQDDGLKSLSVLYKRLVDSLEEKTHLPSILQSLGCIAQTAMPVFETREDEIIEYIRSKILEQSNVITAGSKDKPDWNEIGEICLLKIFSIKTLVKSYLPHKDAHLRPGIEKLLEILKNILAFGEVSKDIKSNDVDKAHMRLASAKAVLRLSRQWEHKIPVDVFYLTLSISEDPYTESRRIFFSKVNQYIKERHLDPKYACAFLLNMTEWNSTEVKEVKHNLLELIQICRQVKARQLSRQTDVSSVLPYPEHILVYLVHALVHHPSFPNMNDCKEIHAFDHIYRRLHLFLSVLLLGDESGKSGGGNVNQKKESTTAVTTIFHSIKCSEDVVDPEKSKVSHVLCELGLSIVKSLIHDEMVTSETSTISLPPSLYKLSESNGETSLDDKEFEWLYGASAMAHYEALNTPNKEQAGSDSGKNEMALEDSDREGNELPLSKMMKILKSQGSKKKKIVKKNTLTPDTKLPESEFDVLGMVREINLDSREQARTMETEDLTSPEYYNCGPKSTKNKDKVVLSPQKRKGNKAVIALSVPTPKRKRSASVHRSHSKSPKVLNDNRKFPYLQPIIMDEKPSISSKKRLSVEKDLGGSIASDVSPFSSGRKEPEISDLKPGVSNNLKKPTTQMEEDKKTSSSKSKKRKRRSIAGLAKCSYSVDENDELVGSRIKVWWPLDRKFYEGMVQSYDPGKKKHTILYDDGDIEVLDLDKERWEPLSNGCSPRKLPKLENLLSDKELSGKKPKGKSKTIGTQNKNSVKKIKRKTTKKEPVGKNRNMLSGGDSSADSVVSGSSGNDSDLSNAHPNSISEVDDANSDEPEEQTVDEQVSEPEENTKQMSDDEPDNPMEEEKPDSSHSADKEDSEDDDDDQPLGAWKQRAGKAG